VHTNPILPVFLFDNTDAPHIKDFLLNFKDSSHFIFVTLRERFGPFLVTTDKMMEELGFSEIQRKNSLYISYNQEDLEIQDLAHMVFYSYVCKNKDIKYGYPTMAIVSKNTTDETIKKAFGKLEHLKDKFYLCVDEGEPDYNFDYKDNRCYLVNIILMILEYHKNIENNAKALESINSNTELQPVSIPS